MRSTYASFLSVVKVEIVGPGGVSLKRLGTPWASPLDLRRRTRCMRSSAWCAGSRALAHLLEAADGLALERTGAILDARVTGARPGPDIPRPPRRPLDARCLPS